MSALESSVTLEDVFSVVEAKRVPLAPELAGYLTLEVADGSRGGGRRGRPADRLHQRGRHRRARASEEGRVRRGDAETSVRAILAKLLEASGSATPALTASAKRKPGTGCPRSSPSSRPRSSRSIAPRVVARSRASHAR